MNPSPGLGRRALSLFDRCLPIATAATAAAATLAGAAGRRTAAGWTKPLPMALLVGHAARTWGERGTADNLLLSGALAFSMAGDRAMLLEEFADDPDVSDARLKLGATLFAGAQLCYSTMAYRRGGRPSTARALRRGVLMAETGTLVALNNPRLLGVIGPYGSALSTMSILAADVDRPQPRLHIGGWLFVLSDATIMNRRYLLTDSRARSAAEAWVLASYFAAQYLLVTGFAQRR